MASLVKVPVTFLILPADSLSPTFTVIPALIFSGPIPVVVTALTVCAPLKYCPASII